ncbi:MAG: DUF1385 domain-containing protein [Peptococcaceae bacterium]|nr:DUF1385 domain-containing protein [Peptococcaceae bacterium]
MENKYPYGGQAVIEGVMMRGPDSRATAVRLPDQTLAIEKKPVNSITKRIPILNKPLVRGVIVLFESLIMGVDALTYSANKAVGDEEEELTTKELVLTIGFAFALAILLFAVLPTALAHFLQGIAPGAFMSNMVEGVLRIVIFLLYVIAISQLSDIKRVFQYHGAEHKVINAYEAGDPLTVKDVQQHSIAHPRCGTSFILIVLVISILVFSCLGEQVLWWRILSRILLLPVIAGISYELLKLSGKYYQVSWCRFLIAPGMWMQKLTTREPDDSQVEVAIFALEAVQNDNKTVLNEEEIEEEKEEEEETSAEQAESVNV